MVEGSGPVPPAGAPPASGRGSALTRRSRDSRRRHGPGRHPCARVRSSPLESLRPQAMPTLPPLERLQGLSLQLHQWGQCAGLVWRARPRMPVRWRAWARVVTRMSSRAPLGTPAPVSPARPWHIGRAGLRNSWRPGREHLWSRWVKSGSGHAGQRTALGGRVGSRAWARSVGAVGGAEKTRPKPAFPQAASQLVPTRRALRRPYRPRRQPPGLPAPGLPGFPGRLTPAAIASSPSPTALSVARLSACPCSSGWCWARTPTAGPWRC